VNTFRVWLQPSDYGCVVLVEGIDNAHWLLDRLGRSFVFRSAEPIAERRNTPLCTFQVVCGPFMSIHQLQKLVAAMPEVVLMRVAAVN
jgi:hypothetical protein